MSKYQSIIHEIADRLLEYFEGEGAVNYIEQTFGCNDDPSKSFVLTMQKIDGLTPCQKLEASEKRNSDLAIAISKIERIASVTPKDRAILEVIESVISQCKNTK